MYAQPLRPNGPVVRPAQGQARPPPGMRPVMRPPNMQGPSPPMAPPIKGPRNGPRPQGGANGVPQRPPGQPYPPSQSPQLVRPQVTPPNGVPLGSPHQSPPANEMSHQMASMTLQPPNAISPPHAGPPQGSHKTSRTRRAYHSGNEGTPTPQTFNPSPAVSPAQPVQQPMQQPMPQPMQYQHPTTPASGQVPPQNGPTPQQPQYGPGQRRPSFPMTNQQYQGTGPTKYPFTGAAYPPQSNQGQQGQVPPGSSAPTPQAARPVQQPAPLPTMGGISAQSQPKSRIDPNQIPSPVQVQEADQRLYDEHPFGTCSKGNLPLASTDFQCIDQGNCNPRFMRITTYNIPHNDELLETSQLPLGLVFQPLAQLRPDEEPIQTVDFGPAGPPRCNRCKGYINPWCIFVEGGRKFVCNLCGFDSEVPAEYFANLDMNGRRIDLDSRPELRFGTVEFDVPKEYWAREPGPVNYVFALDISWLSVQSGVVQQFCKALRDVLYPQQGVCQLPRGSKIGILTFDKSIQFYNLNSTLEQPQMMVVSDIADVFVPIHEGFLVDPDESSIAINALLDTLPDMTRETMCRETAYAPAIRAALAGLANLGGKILIFQASLPNVGPNILKSREDPKLYNTDKEKQLFQPQEAAYRTLGVDLCEAGVCVDVFLFPTAYIDVATTAQIASITGGDVYYYPNFNQIHDGNRFASDLKHNVIREFGYQAVARVRCSNGLRVEEHLGNFFMRNSTDVEFAGIDCDKAFGVILKHDGRLDEKTESSFQCALLYTTATGQRRVRVHTMSVPVTTLLGNVFRYAEMDTTVNLMSKQAVGRTAVKTLGDVREELTDKCTKILAAYRKNCASSTSPGQLILPESFKLFPLYTLSVLKSSFIRSGSTINSDIRVDSMRFVKSLGVADSIAFYYPRMIPIHSLQEHEGLPNPANTHRIVLPPAVRLSYQRLDPAGAYLLENGQRMMLWLGREVPADFLQNVFGVSTLEEVDICMPSLPELDNVRSQKIQAMVNYMQSARARSLSLQVVRQQIDPFELDFANMLVEDKNNENMSYVDYLCFIHRKIQSEISAQENAGIMQTASYWAHRY
ncbi:hypothetical protein BZG36_04584 [Bifiguratus adelaidae]|uniref:Protein transport protein SEC24 n=1 Tax=Bifiguratus adelaidae TaxID=1938954 RepID=A0A261XUU8_9FUNG|nr:hypothetical protein BZG36_04584 [Bifiguratus adelaidae]